MTKFLWAGLKSDSYDWVESNLLIKKETDLLGRLLTL
jgi:hypothetical protein